MLKSVVPLDGGRRGPTSEFPQMYVGVLLVPEQRVEEGVDQVALADGDTKGEKRLEKSPDFMFTLFRHRVDFLTPKLQAFWKAGKKIFKKSFIIFSG